MKYLGHVSGYLKSRLHHSDKKKYDIIKGCELISHVTTKVKYSFPFIAIVDLIKHIYIRIKWTPPLNEDVEKDYNIANILHWGFLIKNMKNMFTLRISSGNIFRNIVLFLLHLMIFFLARMKVRMNRDEKIDNYLR